MAVAQLKNGWRMVRHLVKAVVPLDHVTVLIFLIHHMPHSKKFFFFLIVNPFRFFVYRLLWWSLSGKKNN